MKIESLRIENFRAFKDETIEFDDYTSFVGPNGVGKSTVFHALNLFFRQSKDSQTDLLKLSANDHPEQWQTAFHEEHWKQLKNRPFVFGKFIWALADFGSSIRTEGDRNGMNDKGLVTYDRKIKKDAYYFYKANWNPEPLVYIAERRFTERNSPVVSVKAYSNLSKVELLVNGQKYASKVPNDLNLVVWEEVLLKEGVNHIVVRAEQDNVKLEDECYWTLRAGL